MTALTFATRGLRIGYGGRSVATVPDETISANHVWLVTGPNGSGKTTLLKTIGGLLEPVAGEITPRPGRGRNAAVFVHSVPYLFAGTVGSNMRLNARSEAGVQQVAQEFGLSTLLGAPARTLSHGQRQRVALARAVLAQPRLLLLDEPEGGLDEAALAAWRAFAARVAERRHMTIMLAAHRPAGLEGLPVRTIALA